MQHRKSGKGGADVLPGTPRSPYATTTAGPPGVTGGGMDYMKTYNLRMGEGLSVKFSL